MLGVVVAASVVTILTFYVLFRLGIKYTLTLGFILGVITASLYANALRDWDSSVFFQTRAFHDEKTPFTLSTGDQITMPFMVRNGRHLWLVGTADTKTSGAAELLDRLSLYPWEISPGRVLSLFGFVDYLDSTAGTYHESFLAFFAFDSPVSSDSARGWWGLKAVISASLTLSSFDSLKCLAHFLGLPASHLVIISMQVDSEFSTIVGREVWGYPKDVFDISLLPAPQSTPNSQESITSVLVSKGDEAILETHRVSPLSPLIPFPISGRSVTPFRFQSTTGRSYARLFVRYASFDAKTDTFRIVGDSELAKTWAAADFSPSFWLDIPKCASVLAKPFKTNL